MTSIDACGLLSILASVASAGWTWSPCDSIPGADVLLRPGAVVLLGEIHGTEEAPEAVSRLVCQALNSGLTVTVGLEIPGTEGHVTHLFLSSDGTPEDEERLLSSDWWQRGYQDGRSSEAMFDLIRDLRATGAYGTNLHVALIDDPVSPLGRDRAMADRLAGEIDRRPDDLLIVLTGNLHNRLVPGRSEPMGYHLVLLRPQAEVLALNLTYGGGTAWVCTRDGCGVRGMGGEEGTRLGIEIDPNAAEGPYSGRLHVGTVTASPPARERGQ